MARQRNGQPLVYVEESTVKDLQRLQKALGQLADGPARKRKLNKRLSNAVRPILMDQRESIKAVDFLATDSRDYSRRARRTQGVTKTGRTRKGKGLRQAIAASIRVQTTQGPHAGVRIIQNATDPALNKIGRRLNYKGWVRHPLFGNTRHWYNTRTSNGTDWFWTPFAKRSDDIRRAVREVLDEELADVARQIR